jgi:hypothetical protein
VSVSITRLDIDLIFYLTPKHLREPKWLFADLDRLL